MIGEDLNIAFQDTSSSTRRYKQGICVKYKRLCFTQIQK
jgi:hypothetical protein